MLKITQVQRILASIDRAILGDDVVYDILDEVNNGKTYKESRDRILAQKKKINKGGVCNGVPRKIWIYN